MAKFRVWTAVVSEARLRFVRLNGFEVLGSGFKAPSTPRSVGALQSALGQAEPKRGQRLSRESPVGLQQFQCGRVMSRERLRDFTTVSSEIYSRLEEHYDRVYADWIVEEDVVG